MWVCGVDGCRAGWIAVFRAVADDAGVMPAPPLIRIAVAADLAAIFCAPEAPVAIAIDMPIGLPAQIGKGGRGPEQAVRGLLGARQSSVFAIPARPAVMATTYAECCQLALATSGPPRKVSKQAFNLFPKIRALDAALRAAPEEAARTLESHPELVFRRLAGRPLAEPKKIKGKINPAGMAERRALLAGAGLSAALLAHPVPRGAGADDLMDAIAVSLTAERFARGQAVPYPAEFARDEAGLAIAIWA